MSQKPKKTHQEYIESLGGPLDIDAFLADAKGNAESIIDKHADADVLLESPQLINSLRSALYDENENYALARRLSKRAKFAATVYSEEGTNVKRHGNNLFALAHVEKALHVIYYAKLSKVTTPLGEGIYQNLVWKHYGVAHPTSRKVMLDYLLPEYSVLVCDRQQTSDGRRLWLDVAGGAIASGLTVYAWNQGSGQTAPIQSVFDIDLEKTWGHDVSFQDERIIITK